VIKIRNWFTSDCHFGHANIIKYSKRPFKSLEEMNSTLIKKWNERVKPEDLVFHVGDFCFKNTPNKAHRGEGTIYPSTHYEKQLNGKIIFVKGSHDQNNSCKTCVMSMKIKLGGKNMYLVHDPRYIQFNYDLNIVGHVHKLWKFKRIYKNPSLKYKRKYVDVVNVGVDMWDYAPISIEEILKGYNQWTKTLSKN